MEKGFFSCILIKNFIKIFNKAGLIALFLITLFTYNSVAQLDLSDNHPYDNFMLFQEAANPFSYSPIIVPPAINDAFGNFALFSGVNGLPYTAIPYQPSSNISNTIDNTVTLSNPIEIVNNDLTPPVINPIGDLALNVTMPLEQSVTNLPAPTVNNNVTYQPVSEGNYSIPVSSATEDIATEITNVAEPIGESEPTAAPLANLPSTEPQVATPAQPAPMPAPVPVNNIQQPQFNAPVFNPIAVGNIGVNNNYNTSDGEALNNESSTSPAPSSTASLSGGGGGSGDGSGLPPIANPMSVTVNEDEEVVFSLSGFDPDGGAIVEYEIVTSPAHGAIVIESTTGRCRYKPTSNYHGPDSFQFKVRDGDDNLWSAPAMVTITVTPVNDPPVAYDGSGTTTEDMSVGITLQADDPDGDPLIFRIVGGPLNGSVNIAGNTATYTPDPDFSGTDSFTFVANDTQADSNVATVSITVKPVNDKPVASDVTVTTPEDTPLSITLSATDIDGDPLSYIIVSDPKNGSLSLPPGGSGTVLYTPNKDYNGSDSFTYKATDGSLESNVATVNITVTPVNDPPVVTDGSATVDEDGSVDITLQATDVDDDPSVLTFELNTNATNGVVTINNETRKATYKPNKDYPYTNKSSGSDSFTFKAKYDENLYSAPATIEITVKPVNDQPVLTVDMVSPGTTINEGQTLEISVSAKDEADRDDVLTLTATSIRGADFISTGNSGTFSWPTDLDDSGMHTITFTADDNQKKPNSKDSEDVTVTVNDMRLEVSPSSVTLKVGETIDGKNIQIGLKDIAGNLVDPTRFENGGFMYNISPPTSLIVGFTMPLRVEGTQIKSGRAIFSKQSEVFKFELIGPTGPTSKYVNLTINTEAIVMGPADRLDQPVNTASLMQDVNVPVDKVVGNIYQLGYWISDRMELMMDEVYVYWLAGGIAPDHSNILVYSERPIVRPRTWTVTLTLYSPDGSIAGETSFSFTGASMPVIFDSDELKVKVGDMLGRDIEQKIATVKDGDRTHTGLGYPGNIIPTDDPDGNGSGIGLNSSIFMGLTAECVEVTGNLGITKGDIIVENFRVKCLKPFLIPGSTGKITIQFRDVIPYDKTKHSFTVTVGDAKLMVEPNPTTINEDQSLPVTGTDGNGNPVSMPKVKIVSMGQNVTGNLYSYLNFTVDPISIPGVGDVYLSVITGPDLLISSSGNFRDGNDTTDTYSINVTANTFVTYPDPNDPFKSITVPVEIKGQGSLVVTDIINHPPVLDPIGNKTVNEGEKLTININARDPDSDFLFFIIPLDLPPGASFSSYSFPGGPDMATFSWTPNYTEATQSQPTKEYRITFRVNDMPLPPDIPLEDSEEITITVNNVNRPPVVFSPVYAHFDIGINKAIVTFIGNDLDNDLLTYSIVTQPANGTVTINGDIATYTPGVNFQWEDRFDFKANDGQADSNIGTVVVSPMASPIYPYGGQPGMGPAPGLPPIDANGDGIDDYTQDLDNDGLTGSDEVNIYHTDPMNADTDGDGFNDGQDQHPTDPTQH